MGGTLLGLLHSTGGTDLAVRGPLEWRGSCCCRRSSHQLLQELLLLAVEAVTPVVHAFGSMEW